MSGRAVSILERVDRELSVFDPDWSPDGNLLAFAVDDVTEGQRTGIYVSRPDGSRARRLSARSWPSGPTWSRDGQWLAFVNDVPLQSDYAGEIWIVQRDGTGLRRLTTTRRIGEHSPEWIPVPDR
jgi:Tol biopolymer transport system component